jgi:hypothetical protein
LPKWTRVCLIRFSIVPGPGFYNWSKVYERKASEPKGKPSIQFKFVYGHPS